MSSLGFFTTLDWIIVGVAAVLCLALGLGAGRRVRTGVEFLTAGRRFSALAVALSLTATVGSGLLLFGGVAGVAERGLVVLRPLLLGWFWLPLLLLLWAPVLQRCRLITAPEYLGRRFSTGVQRLAAVVSVVLLTLLLALELATFGATFRALTSSPALVWAAAAAGLAAAYTAWGGQRSAIVTDLFQVVLLGAGMVVLVLGASGAIQLASLWHSTPVTQRSLVPEPLSGGPFHAVGGLLVDAAVISLVGVLASQAVIGRLVAGRGERAAGTGAMLGLGPLLLLLVGGVAVAGLLHGWLVDVGRLPSAEPDSMSLASVLSAVASSPGWLGLMAAALLAAVLSTADSLLVGVAAVVAVDLDGPEAETAAEAATGPRDRRRLVVARATVGAAALLALGLAALFDWMGGLAGLAGLAGGVLGGPLGLVLLAGLLSRRIGARVAWVALLSGVLAGLASVAWMAGPTVAPADVLRACLASLGATSLVLVVGRLLAWRETPPVRINLTWRNLTPAWPHRRARLRLRLRVAAAPEATSEPSPSPSPASKPEAMSDPVALPKVKLPASTAKELDLSPGNEVHVTAARRAWLGLRSFRAVVQKGTTSGDRLEAPKEALDAAGLGDGSRVVVERVA